MNYCKIVRENEFTNKYPECIDVYRVMNYVLNWNKAIHEVCGGNLLIGGSNVLVLGSQYIARQFLGVQGDMSGCSRRLYHIIVSFDPEISRLLRISQIKFIADKIINLYPEYQSLYVLHENQENAHIHFLFNNIPVYTDCPKLTNKLNIGKIEYIFDSYISDYVYKIPNGKQ